MRTCTSEYRALYFAKDISFMRVSILGSREDIGSLARCGGVGSVSVDWPDQV
jgi:hypothetical protein